MQTCWALKTGRVHVVWSASVPPSIGTKLFRPLNRFQRLHLSDALRLRQPRSASACGWDSPGRSLDQAACPNWTLSKAKVETN